MFIGVPSDELIRPQFAVQAVEQHASLLQGLDFTSALICRLGVMEDLYRSRSEFSLPDPKHTIELMEEFEANLTALYSKILEFQARALCYLRKHRVTQVLRNMFKQDGWDELLREIKESEVSAKSFTSLIDAAEVRGRLEELRDTTRGQDVAENVVP